MNAASPIGKPTTNHGDALYWTLQILGWSAYAVIGLSFAVQAGGWKPALLVGFGLYPLYSIGLTHLLRRMMHRWRSTTSRPLQKYAVRLVPATLLIGLVQLLLIALVDLVFEGSNSSFLRLDSMLYTAMGTTTVTTMWVVLYVLLSTNRRHRDQRTQLQLALREAELRALEAQINPHFLFNCLNSIRALVAENPGRAQDMITRLANIFRYNLHRDSSHTVPLASEVEVVTDYLALESVRFEDRLRVRFAISPAASQTPVPSMLLQTLVENALKHGIATLPAGGDLVITADQQLGTTRIEVENTGQLGAPSQPGGVGLANTRERLRLLYGDQASLELNGKDGRVVATVLIPSQTAA